MCKGVATQGLIWESYEAISGPLVPPFRAWPPTCQGRKGHPGGKLPPYSCPLLVAKHLKLSTLVTWSFLLCSCLSVCLSDWLLYQNAVANPHSVVTVAHLWIVYEKEYLFSPKKNVYTVPVMYGALTYLSPGDTVELRQIGSFMRFIF